MRKALQKLVKSENVCQEISKINFSNSQDLKILQISTIRIYFICEEFLFPGFDDARLERSYILCFWVKFLFSSLARRRQNSTHKKKGRFSAILLVKRDRAKSNKLWSNWRIKTGAEGNNLPCNFVSHLWGIWW